MNGQPKIENAPGLVWKPRKGGWEARWQARTDLVRNGYKPNSARLWCGADLTDATISFIQDRCRVLQTEMLVWGRGGVPIVGTFNGSLKSLIEAYQTDVDSPYRTKLEYQTRINYDARHRRIELDYGHEALSDIRARDLKRWHETWMEGGKVTQAHGLIGQLRILMNFGATILESEECNRIANTLSKMRFTMAKSRSQRITAEQADAVRKMARRMQYPSIALAQAFQFETMMRQKDVIGEWLPLSEPGITDTMYGNEKWLKGLRWEEIDENLILRHLTWKRKKPLTANLKLLPMVMDELNRLGTLPTRGPVIVSETTHAPYAAAAFRKRWRIVANSAKVPPEVFNMDSRSGGATEAFLADAPPDSVRLSMKHSALSTTAKYNRGDEEASSQVANARVAYRNKTGTKDK